MGARKGVPGTKSLSKRNLNLINGKNRRVGGTPINYDQRKRIGQPMGFPKKQPAASEFDIAGQHKVRKSFAITG